MPTVPLSQLKVQLPMEELADFCRKWKIAKLEIFGSALRDDFGPESDLDFLYTLEEDAPWGLMAFSRLWEELKVLVGRDVDLVDRETLERSYNYLLRHEIMKETSLVFES